MKKIYALVTILLLILFCGCSKEETKITINENKDANILTSFELKLEENNIDYEKVVLKNSDSNMLTYYYYIEDKNPLIVHYYKDTDSTEYKSIYKNGFINNLEQNSKTEVIIKNGLVIETNTELKTFETIKNILNEL